MEKEKMENELENVLNRYDEEVKKFFNDIVEETKMYQNGENLTYLTVRNEVGTYVC